MMTKIGNGPRPLKATAPGYLKLKARLFDKKNFSIKQARHLPKLSSHDYIRFSEEPSLRF